MKGELITDWNSLKMGDKIEWDGRILQFLFITKSNKVMCRNGRDETYLINLDLEYYHHIEDKPSMIDLLGKWYYDIQYNHIFPILMFDNGLQINGVDIDTNKTDELITEGKIIVKDTLEEIKEVYRAKNT